MAAVIPFAIKAAALISTIGGAVSSISGLTKAKEKPPEVKPLPTAPTVEGAKTNAADEIQKRRRAMMNAGGQTDITQGSAILNPAAVNKKSLLGQ